MNHSYNIGDQVSYPADRCPFEVVGVRRDEIEIQGDFSGGIAGPPWDRERDWVKPEEVKPYVEPDPIEKLCRCQRIQQEYKGNLYLLSEVVHAALNDRPIGIDNLTNAMAFIYREGWGDCFMWDGQISGEKTRKEFFEILKIDRYGRNMK